MSNVSPAHASEQIRLADWGPAAVFGRATRWLARLEARSRRTAEARQAERILHALPDHLLKDMGITRGDISARVHGRWPE